MPDIKKLEEVLNYEFKNKKLIIKDDFTSTTTKKVKNISLLTLAV